MQDLRLAKGMETKQRILEAAIEINQDQGPDALSASAISKKADVSKSTLFHHFKTIQDVRLAVFEYAVETFDQASELHNSSSLEDYLIHIGESVLFLNKSYPGLVQAYYATRAYSIYGSTIYSRMKTSYERHLDHIEQTLLKEIKINKPEAEIKTMAALIAQTMDGMILGHLSLQSEVQLRKSWGLFVSQMIK